MLVSHPVNDISLNRLDSIFKHSSKKVFKETVSGYTGF